jgi:hydrogenase accessory protein HypB
MSQSTDLRRQRQHLHFDALMQLARSRFEKLPEQRRCPAFALADALMAGLALFALKDPSLLAFQRRTLDHNLRSVFGLKGIPSDTQMRVILDDVDPERLHPLFKDVFRQVQRGKVLEEFVFLNGCYLIALDGVEHFCSKLLLYNDAVRLARSQVPVKQITTGAVCHLEAAMVQTALEGWDINELDCLFIENVGNLVCPATFDLGEELRLVLFSVTEGEDKPLKYPTIFNTADVAVITKMDLATAVEFDRCAAHRNIQSVRPGMQVFEVSAKTGQGMEEWLHYLQIRIASRIQQRKGLLG